MDLRSDALSDTRNPKRIRHGRLKFPICSIVVQIALIVLLSKFADYPADANATIKRSCDILRHRSKEPMGGQTALGLLSSEVNHIKGQIQEECNYDEDAVNVFGPPYQDTQFFIISGISLLFLGIRHHSLSTMALTLYVISLCLQWSFLCRGLIRLDSNYHPIKPSPDVFVITVFFAEAVLISWGIILGRASQMQLLVMTVLEIPFAVVNDYILLEIFKVNDPSGGIIYNVFGTYYGLSVARVLYKKGEGQYDEKRESTVFSETLAFLGSNILWVFFPTAIGAMFTKERRLRCILNTYFALTGSAMTGTVIGMLLDKKGKMTPSHVQNAVIASAVTMCAIADAMMGIYTAVIIGCISGTISIFTSVYVQPFLADKCHIVDSCASHSLHGLPAIFGGIVSAILAYLATEAEYGISLYELYPARAPKPESEELLSLQELWPSLKPGEGRSASLQAAYQIACLGITIGLAVCSGIFTGLLMRLKIFDQLNEDEFYDDSIMWNMPTGDKLKVPKIVKEHEKYTQTMLEAKISNPLTHL